MSRLPPETFRSTCNRFVHKNLCGILFAIVMAGSTGLGSVVTLYLTDYRQTAGRIADIDTRTAVNISTLNNHVAVESQSMQDVIGLMRALQQSSNAIQSKLDIIQYRLDVAGEELHQASPAAIVGQ